MPPRFGAHVSTAGGVSKAFGRAASIGCEAMQIFTRNNSRWHSKPLEPKEIERWWTLAGELDIRPVASHASYLINLSSPKPDLWRKSIDAFVDELQRAEALGLLGVVVHPGSHMGEGETWGISRIAAALDQCHERTAGFQTLTLLETTAGTGQHLGYRFEQLGAMREQCAQPQRVAVCFDTCHVLAAGYDFRNAAGYANVMQAFDEHIGLDLLKCFHFNDSKFDLGSRKDRHEHIGKGYVGLDAFRLIINDPRFVHVPMLLETPKSKDLHEDVENLAVLRGLVENQN
ncbi:MAG TPA: deoxyribonuclease IV [Caldilineae bacterium]|nr:deoxyribonuclease IV [Caldilineae bacterium]